MKRLPAYALALSLSLTGAACGMIGHGASKAELTKALEAHAESVRWGGVRGLENTPGQRVTDFEVRSVRFDDTDRTKATVRVEVQGYGANMALRAWLLEQKWVVKGDDWVVLSEREIKPAKPGPGKKTALIPTPRQ